MNCSDNDYFNKITFAYSLKAIKSFIDQISWESPFIVTFIINCDGPVYERIICLNIYQRIVSKNIEIHSTFSIKLNCSANRKTDNQSFTAFHREKKQLVLSFDRLPIMYCSLKIIISLNILTKWNPMNCKGLKKSKKIPFSEFFAVISIYVTIRNFTF